MKLLRGMGYGDYRTALVLALVSLATACVTGTSGSSSSGLPWSRDLQDPINPPRAFPNYFVADQILTIVFADHKPDQHWPTQVRRRGSDVDMVVMEPLSQEPVLALAHIAGQDQVLLAPPGWDPGSLLELFPIIVGFLTSEDVGHYEADGVRFRLSSDWQDSNQPCQLPQNIELSMPSHRQWHVVITNREFSC